MTVDTLIHKLKELRQTSPLRGNTVVVVSVQDIEYIGINDTKLDIDSDGAVILLVSEDLSDEAYDFLAS